MDPHDYLRHAVDPVRLAILGTGAIEKVDVDGIAEALGVPRKKVLSHMARLTEEGLLEDGRTDLEALSAIGRRLPSAERVAGTIVEGPWSEAEARVLSTFFSGSRLTQIPANRTKRLVVLERLAQEFAPGVRYTEKEVSFTLQLFHADYAALRRYLVDEGLLTRADGVYWRSGGRYDAEGEVD